MPVVLSKFLGKKPFAFYFFVFYFLTYPHSKAISLKDFHLRSGKTGQFKIFNQNGTWTVPSGVKLITAIVIGAGGGSSFSIMTGGGGGGGGSCIMRGIIPLISANGGDGADIIDTVINFGKPGEKKSETIKVTPGEIINIYVGGGGGTANLGGPSSGGYGFCGIGGRGGNFEPVDFPGGLGGLNKGGGQGGHPYGTAQSATSENGAGLSGGTATAGGIAIDAPGGGGSGGNGGCINWASGYFFNGGVGSLTYYNCNVPITAEPGEAGFDNDILPVGGAGGIVYILW